MRRIYFYDDISNLLDDFIDQEGITTATYRILLYLANRVGDKAKMLESQLKEGDDRCSTSGLP